MDPLVFGRGRWGFLMKRGQAIHIELLAIILLFATLPLAEIII
jgi:hypothetical protein